LANDEVWDDVKRVVDFWVALGADGFRVDAATLMFNGMDDGPSFEERFDDLRAYLRRRAPHVALLAEADVTGDKIARYFDGDRFDLLYGFLANNAFYLSLVRECATPLLTAVDGLRTAVGRGRFLNFVRNLDELDLGQLTDEERNEVLHALAPDEFMQIYGRGIRRGWAPMMHSQAQLRMSMSLLFALPGVPLLMYGQEIGMGDDLSLDGRATVRLPMQWNDGPAGGFSENSESTIAALARHGGARGYRRVNVEAQRDDPESLLALTRDLATLRRKHPSIGTHEWERIEGESEAVAILRFGDVVAAHNLSDSPRPIAGFSDAKTLLGDPIDAGELPGYGFGWALQH